MNSFFPLLVVRAIVILAAVTVVATTAANSTSVGTAVPLSAETRAILVNKHNELRSLVGRGNGSNSLTRNSGPEACTAADMKAMAWDDNLARVAQAYAEKCVWEHNPKRNEEAGYSIGENLFSTTKSSPSDLLLLSGLDGWYNEVIAFNWTDGSCDLVKSPDGCGHYTQMVWANTSRVGCVS